MPHKDPDMHRRYQRNAMRTLRHGPGWRQVFIDCDGMCQYQRNGSGICGEVMDLEFHDPFGEDKKGEGKMQQRVLLCRNHHRLFEHDMKCKAGRISRLAEDIEWEIAPAGGQEAWLEKYGLQKATNA